MEYHTCGTKEKKEEVICEPKVKEDERKEEEHQDDLKIAAIQDAYNSLLEKTKM